MSDLEITEAQIAAMTTQERRRLMERLERPESEVALPAEVSGRLRRRRLALVVGSALFLVPWTMYLGFTLPRRYVADHWTLTWVGFDVLLAAMFAVTAYLAFRRRQLLVLSSFVTGVLLLCDAWFDVTTADAHDLPFSLADALLVEIPIAVLLIGTSMRLLHVLLARVYALEDHQRLWAVQLHLGEPLKPTSKVQLSAVRSDEELEADDT